MAVWLWRAVLSKMGARVSMETAKHSIHPASQIPKEDHMIPAVPTPWAHVHTVCAFYACLGAQSAIGPTFLMVMGIPCAVHS